MLPWQPSWGGISRLWRSKEESESASTCLSSASWHDGTQVPRKDITTAILGTRVPQFAGSVLYAETFPLAIWQIKQFIHWQCPAAARGTHLCEASGAVTNTRSFQRATLSAESRGSKPGRAITALYLPAIQLHLDACTDFYMYISRCSQCQNGTCDSLQ